MLEKMLALDYEELTLDPDPWIKINVSLILQNDAK